jgi:hypothetical protein
MSDQFDFNAELFYAPHEAGDRTVGEWPTPHTIFGEIPIGIPGTDDQYVEIYTVATLPDEIDYQVPYALYTDEEKVQADKHLHWYGDYPLGTRFLGNPKDFAERLILCWNFLRGYPSEQLHQMKSMQIVMEDIHEQVEYDHYRMSEIVAGYIENFKVTGNMFDGSWRNQTPEDVAALEDGDE